MTHRPRPIVRPVNWTRDCRVRARSGPASFVEVDRRIARSTAQVYTPVHGETKPESSLIGKEETDGAVY
jgi:hypothetical protein